MPLGARGGGVAGGYPGAVTDEHNMDSPGGGTASPSDSGAHPPTTGTGTGSLVRDIVLYSLARLALVVVLAAVVLYLPRVFGVEIPLLVAALFAVLIALPLSLVLFAPLRRRVNEGIAAVDERRRLAREDLEERLRGEGR